MAGEEDPAKDMADPARPKRSVPAWVLRVAKRFQSRKHADPESTWMELDEGLSPPPQALEAIDATAHQEADRQNADPESSRMELDEGLSPPGQPLEAIDATPHGEHDDPESNGMELDEGLSPPGQVLEPMGTTPHREPERPLNRSLQELFAHALAELESKPMKMKYHLTERGIEIEPAQPSTANKESRSMIFRVRRSPE